MFEPLTIIFVKSLLIRPPLKVADHQAWQSGSARCLIYNGKIPGLCRVIYRNLGCTKTRDKCVKALIRVHVDI